MDSRPPKADALLCTAAALLLSVETAMDRLLSLLPTASRAPAPEADKAEDIAI
jgi:hypothetical protein